MPLRALVALLLFMSAPLAAEVIDRVTLDNERQRFVSAPSGLRLRESPSLAAPVIATMPFGSAVFLLKQSEIEAEFDGLRGYWAVVRYEAHTGWAFTGFLSNEILPDANVRHWNASKTMYFVILRLNPGYDCSYGNCKISIHGADRKLIADRFGLTVGWKDNMISLSETAVCGSGGGHYESLWDPVTNREEETFASFFINNAGNPEKPLPDDSGITSVLCLRDRCFYVNENAHLKRLFIYRGHPNKGNPSQFIGVVDYAQRHHLTFRGTNFFLNVDGKLYSLPELKPQ